jgi:hypothetical protein
MLLRAALVKPLVSSCGCRYTNNFESQLNALELLRNRHPVFVSQVEAQLPKNSVGLTSFIIQPVQRVPRYVQHLSDLLQLTKPQEDCAADDAEAGAHDAIRRALAEIQQLAADITATSNPDGSPRKVLSPERLRALELAERTKALRAAEELQRTKQVF